MRDHVTDDEMAWLRAGQLRPAQVAEVGRHLSTCAHCAERVAADLDIPRMTRDLRVFIEAENDDLDQSRSAVAKPSLWYLAASLAAIALLGIVFALRRPSTPAVPPPPAIVTTTTQPRPTATSHGRADWDRWVAEALAARRLTVSSMVADLQPRPAQYRGARTTDRQLQPNGRVVESTRPLLSWKKIEGDVTYNVVLAIDEDRIIESGPLSMPQWQPPNDLERGREYSWQVEVASTITPAARFRVIDPKALAEIDSARAKFPNDFLLQAVLLARHGLTHEAQRALDEYRKHGDPALAKALGESLRQSADPTRTNAAQ